jgi:hypothetical protein
MPTGYTHCVADGEATELADFVLKCAEQFIYPEWSGGLVDPEPDVKYYQDQLDGHKRELAAWESMGDEWRQEVYKREQLKDAEFAEIVSKQEAEQLSRYNAMLAKVNEWKSPHEGLHRFVRKQLIDSIKWDCSPGSFPAMSPISYEDWAQSYERRIQNRITDCEKEIAKAYARAEKYNTFIKALYESLGKEVPADQ